MRQLIRVGIGIIGGVTVFLAVAFFFQWPIVADIWPWTGYSALSSYAFYFMSSIAAAIGLPVLWIALTNKLHAVVPGTLDLIVSFTGIAIFMGQSYAATPGNSRLLVGAGLMVVGIVTNLILFGIGRNLPIQDHRPLPTPVRVSFGVFIVVLILVGGALILKTPNVLPWTTTVEASVVYGWIFLGAAVYFIFAVLNPNWENATGQLIGFLAYDIVLIVPFIRHFSDVRPEHRLSLIIYMAVVVYSGLLAIYYLFIHKPTRLLGGVGVEKAA